MRILFFVVGFLLKVYASFEIGHSVNSGGLLAGISLPKWPRQHGSVRKHVPAQTEHFWPPAQKESRCKYIKPMYTRLLIFLNEKK